MSEKRTFDTLNQHPVERMVTLQIGSGWFPESPGGLERFYFDLQQSFPSVGVRSIGLVVGSSAVAANSGGRVSAVAPAGASLGRRYIAMRREIASKVAEHDPDIVAAHFALYAGVNVDRLRRRPFVVHFQGPWADESRREGAAWFACHAKKIVEKSVYRRADRCICLSHAFKRTLVETYGVSEDYVRVVPGAVDTRRFDIATSRQDAKIQLGWTVDRPIVLCVRRLVRRMGLEKLIDAVEEVRQSCPDVLILIAGRGPLEGELRQRIQDKGLDSSVRLLGFVPDDQLPITYRAADLSIVPTESLEGFGLTTVESLSAGTPVLVTPIGGLPEVISDFTPELILEDASSRTIAEGVKGVLKGRLSLPSDEACKAFARSRYDWDVITRQIVDVYAEAIAAH